MDSVWIRCGQSDGAHAYLGSGMRERLGFGGVTDDELLASALRLAGMRVGSCTDQQTKRKVAKVKPTREDELVNQGLAQTHLTSEPTARQQMFCSKASSGP